jgi:hypothetical protein
LFQGVNEALKKWDFYKEESEQNKLPLSKEGAAVLSKEEGPGVVLSKEGPSPITKTVKRT